MTTLALPNAHSISTRPLSTHGMPKPPRVTSPDRPHRFLGRGISLPDASVGYPNPRSPGPMSPPMSARSFGTIIDSAPSTPAYSPRMDYEWNSSTLVLLRPLSSSSEPSSPTEPVWDMIKPTETPHQAPTQSRMSPKPPSAIFREESPSSVIVRDMPSDPRLISSPPPPRRKVVSLPKPKPLVQAAIVDVPHKEYEQPHNKEVEEIKAPTFPPPGSVVAPFGKLASKMKLMLRRRSTAEEKQEKQEKKKKKEKEKDYYDPMEDDIHWSEY
jgi:hypothetical protein